MALLDLTAEARAVGLHPETWPELDPDTLAVARSTWRGRMVNEHISAQVFAGLVPQLMRAGVAAARQAAVAGMIAEEMHHARLCAAVLAGLGELPRAELPELAAMPRHEDCSALEGLLRNVLSVSCLSETVAVALIQAERQEIEVPEIAEILRQILGDEVRHARFGWTLLEELGPDLDPALRERLGDYLAVAFAHLETHEIAHLAPGPSPSAAAAMYGVCDGNEARHVFYATVTDVIVPQLEAQGLPAARAWAQRAAK